MWHTNIIPRIAWIQETMKSNSYLTAQEEAKVSKGLKCADRLFADVDESEVPDGEDASSVQAVF